MSSSPPDHVVGCWQPSFIFLDLGGSGASSGWPQNSVAGRQALLLHKQVSRFPIGLLL